MRRYLTFMKTTVSSKGQIVLPAEIRREDDIREGQVFEVKRLDRGKYRLVRREPQANEGLVDDWLLACPEKGFFVPWRHGDSNLTRSKRDRVRWIPF